MLLLRVPITKNNVVQAKVFHGPIRTGHLYNLIVILGGVVNISFQDSHLKQLCEDEKYCTRKLGARNSVKLRNHLAQLQAAANPTELVLGKPHYLTGDRIGNIALSLDGGCRLTFGITPPPPPPLPSGGIDWSSVSNITINFIGDYHD